jgi:hypothetical protein
MSDDTTSSDRMLTVREFCTRNSIGLTTCYAEIGSGRLIAHKCRTKTLISVEAERAWRAKLPRKAPWPEAQAEARA